MNDGRWGTDRECPEILELLPLRFHGEVSRTQEARVERHLGDCDPCREEWAFLTFLARARPRVPAGLRGRIVAAARAERLALDARGGWWSATAAAAAVVVLALGIGVASQQAGSGGAPGTWAVALEMPAEGWGGDDWVVAGAPVLDGLSDEALERLLEEEF